MVFNMHNICLVQAFAYRFIRELYKRQPPDVESIKQIFTQMRRVLNIDISIEELEDGEPQRNSQPIRWGTLKAFLWNEFDDDAKDGE